jgi:hypothetical protein
MKRGALLKFEMNRDISLGSHGCSCQYPRMKFPVLDCAPGCLIEPEKTGAFQDCDAGRFAGGSNLNLENYRALLAGDPRFIRNIWGFIEFVLEMEHRPGKKTSPASAANRVFSLQDTTSERDQTPSTIFKRTAGKPGAV